MLGFSGEDAYEYFNDKADHKDHYSHNGANGLEYAEFTPGAVTNNICKE
ncbi:MAG: hypothetical protein K9N07_10815 [Candidatus Cloacimonetes bacterium]|nr:hypothetical protein [Candidatus Cloacimonadota bacterium]